MVYDCRRSKCVIVGEKSVDIYTQGQPTRGTSYLSDHLTIV